MNFNIIGAGCLGKNIALTLIKTQQAQLDSICNRSLKSTIQAQKAIGQGQAVSRIEELPSADITWISSNDDAIESIVKQLALNPRLKPNSFIIHCSGVLNSQLLIPLKTRGCFIASFHPLKAFQKEDLGSTIFDQTDCVIEGDEPVCSWLESTFKLLNANIITIQPEYKAKYHAAAVIASNYLITLASCSEQLMLEAGIPKKNIKLMICNLMQSNINNLLKTQSIAEALTGPLMRGDTKTLELHLKAIEDVSITKLYKVAGLATIPMVSLDEEKIELLKTILSYSL